MSDEADYGGGGEGGGGEHHESSSTQQYGSRQYRLHSSESMDTENLFLSQSKKSENDKSGKFEDISSASDDATNLESPVKNSTSLDHPHTNVKAADKENGRHLCHSDNEDSDNEDADNADSDNSSIDFHSDSPECDQVLGTTSEEQKCEELLIKEDDYDNDTEEEELCSDEEYAKDTDNIKKIDDNSDVDDNDSKVNEVVYIAQDNLEAINEQQQHRSAALSAGKVNRDFLKELKLKVKSPAPKGKEEDLDEVDGKGDSSSLKRSEEEFKEKFEEKNTGSDHLQVEKNASNSPGTLNSTTTTATSSTVINNSNQDEMSEEGDELAELQSVSKGKEISDFDFSAIESHSSALNIEAGRSRAALRQKGSLAGRRKPTRASVRASTATDVPVIETVEANNRNREQLVNGQAAAAEIDDAEEQKAKTAEVKQDTNTALATLSQGPVLRTGKTLQGVKTAIILPGIADRSRLRASKPPVPLPTTANDNKSNQDSDNSTATPPWMLESKLRRQSKPPVPLPAPLQGETAKLQQESQPERPAWMKDAETKRKRASNIITERDSKKEQKDKENEQEQERPVAPWMREAQLRKINRPGPMTIGHKDILSNIDNVAILEHDNPFKDSQNSQGEDASVGDSGIKNNGKMSGDSGIQQTASSSSSNRKLSDGPVAPPRRHKQNREILKPLGKPDQSSPVPTQPVKKADTTSSSSLSSISSSSNVREQDENKPPMTSSPVVRDTSKGSAIITTTSTSTTKPVPPIKSNMLPPLKNPHKLPCSDLSNEEQLQTSSTTTSSNNTPNKVVMREKSTTSSTPNNNNGNSSPATSSVTSNNITNSNQHAAPKPALKRPITLGPSNMDSPMSMWDTPKWKRDLMEKKKKRESLNPVLAGGDPASGLVSEDKNNGSQDTNSPWMNIDDSLPPWKRELEQRKSRRSSTRIITAEEPGEVKTESTPDWMKQLQRRRSRLADAGVIKNNENSDS